jgi:hypothetical protein
MTLHCFGDSFTYGFNFDENTRVQSVYPYHLAKKLNLNFKNHAIPAASTWRTARLISNMSFTKEDVVIVSWGFPDRFEFAASTSENLANSKLYNGNDQSFQWLGDIVENYNDTYCRRFFINLLNENLPAKWEIKQFAALAYDKFYNKEWFEEMFLVMFNSTVNVLKNYGCKFLMFNTFDVPYKKTNLLLEIPEYVLGPYTNMTKHIRNVEFKFGDEFKYWDEKEHKQVAEILFNSLKNK